MANFGTSRLIRRPDYLDPRPGQHFSIVSARFSLSETPLQLLFPWVSLMHCHSVPVRDGRFVKYSPCGRWTMFWQMRSRNPRRIEVGAPELLKQRSSMVSSCTSNSAGNRNHGCRGGGSRGGILSMWSSYIDGRCGRHSEADGGAKEKVARKRLEDPKCSDGAQASKGIQEFRKEMVVIKLIKQ